MGDAERFFRSIPIHIPVKIIIWIVVIVAAGIVADKLIKKVKRTIRNATYGVRNIVGTVSNIGSAVNQITNLTKELDVDTPAVKTVGGATKMYLEQIQKDFPEFHNSDAENEVKDFVRKYIQVKHGGADKSLIGHVDSRNEIDLSLQERGTVSNIQINQIAIYGYTKSAEYATITYRVSVGFNNNSRRIETRYEVKYTLRLKENEIAGKYMKCNNCGGAYGSPENGVCPYCGTAVIKDTAFHWDISNVSEI